MRQRGRLGIGISGLTFSVVVLVLFFTTSPAIAGRGDDGHFKSGGVGVGVWFQMPESGDWVSVPVGVADDPEGYRFELACFDKNNGDAECLKLNEQCNAAKDGRLVYWFSGLKVADRDSWGPYDPDGDGNSEPSCIYAEKPRDVMDEIAAVIAREFQSRPVVAGDLSLQPSPHTLIRANTNFYVDSEEQTFDISLLDQDVRIVATPREFTWHYGDGTSYGPVTESGGALRATHLGDETNTSHAYQETGDYPVSVTVYFRGEYSVNGGQLIPIDGRGEFTTAEQTISVWKSESRNVADTCLENPTSWGC